MTRQPHLDLSRRERQIIDILYANERATYVPTLARDNAKKSAMRHMLRTFFDGSTEQAISALLGDSSARLSGDELDRLSRLIDQARRNGA